MPLLEVANLSKHYDRPAVQNIGLTLKHGDILCLLGPSGCGKTTLLRLIAGLEKPDGGQVVFAGRDVTEIPPHQRHFGLMFQDFALFPHKSVSENVAFGLQMQKQAPLQIKRRTVEMLNLVGLADLADQNVAQISGGERQRVALARSLAPQPQLLMLDEPLGALDRALRERLLSDIRSILKRLQITAIFVTHDQSEALAVADRIAVMNRGAIEQIATPEELYMTPESVFVARFLGFKNLLQGSVRADGGIETGLGRFYPAMVDAPPGATVTLVIRPEGARLARPGDGAAMTATVAGEVTARFFNGQSYRVELKLKDKGALVFDLPNWEPPPQMGEMIHLRLTPSTMVIIP